MIDAQTPVQYCVISHTHWDREWYMPFEQFRIRLVDLIDNVLDILAEYEDYIFHMDAQTIVLEDYLEIRPYRRADLERYVQEGRLLIGPWYVQNDFFLTSGESTVRNLLIGSAMAEAFGACSKAGYAPDQFGLISQLPQILNGFGVTSCIFGRGYMLFEKNEQGENRVRITDNEFRWKGQDGSEVLGIYMRHWYNNAQRFSANRDKAAKYLRHIDQALRGCCRTPYFLLMNGVDHLEAQEDLLPILEDLNKGLPEETVIRQVTMDDYVTKVGQYLEGQDLDEMTGELRHGHDGAILQGTLSARSYLKQQNVQSQALLENKLEPLCSMITCLGWPDAYKYDFLTYLWKTLIQNHPHDSICGCSRDPVHRHMEDRTERIMEAGNELLKRTKGFIVNRLDRSNLDDDGYLVTVFNTLQESRSEVVEARCAFLSSDGVANARLFDPSDNEVPFEVVRFREMRETLLSPINLPGQADVDECVIRFQAKDVPAMSYRVYRIAPDPQGRPTQKTAEGIEARRQAPVTLENECLKVTVDQQGKVALEDKANGRTYEDVLTLEDQADVGTAYNFVAAAGDEPIIVSEHKPVVTLVQKTSLAQTVRLDYAVELPAHYDFEREARSADTEKNTISLALTLHAGSPRLGVEVTADNASRDHRLRLLVNTDIDSDHSRASTPFDVVERDRREVLEQYRQNGCQPNSGLVMTGDGSHSLAVFNEGLSEYEHLLNRRDSIAMTVLRATGFIYFETGHRRLSEDWKVEENQCLREMSFRLAILPGGARIANPELRAREFLVPLLTHCDAADPKKLVGGRPCVQDSELQEIFYRELPESEKRLPLEQSVARVEGGEVVLSAVKQSADRQFLALRLYNPEPEAQQASVTVHGGFRDAVLLRLDETAESPLELKEGALHLDFAPKQVMTVGLRIPKG